MNNAALTASETELLNILVEECAEVIQATQKIFRHGLTSRNPYDPNSPTNEEHLNTELGQLLCILKMILTGTTLLNSTEIKDSEFNKFITINRFLHYYRANTEITLPLL